MSFIFCRLLQRYVSTEMYMYVHLSDNNEFNIYVQVHQIINTKHSSHLTHNPLKQSILTLYRFFVYFYLFFFFLSAFYINTT